VKALSVLPSPMIFTSEARIFELALKHRPPSMATSQRVVHAGSLISYGPNARAMYGRVATYIDRILEGGSPAELPVERPTKFDLVINLKTAKALGLTVPRSLLLRADRIIE
jgi:putative ABC transport system substrate-binding protein